jgi:hypothetical protein
MKDGNTKVRLQLSDLLRNRWLRTAEHSSCPRKRTLFSHSAWPEGDAAQARHLLS